MSIKFNVRRIDATDATVTIEEHPDQCPVCRRHLMLTEFINSLLHGNTLQLIYQCANKECNAFFIAYYAPYAFSRSNEYHHIRSKPGGVPTPSISKRISDLSPEFITIYTDAYKAEKLGLDGVSGVGYRKALEFLVKDYAIKILNKDAEMIQEKWLGKVIEEDIDDKRLHRAFKLASWLGNDQTHYTRKWEDYNLNDLKRLIEIAMRYIDDMEDLEHFGEVMEAQGTEDG